MGDDLIKNTNDDFKRSINQIATVIHEIDKELKDRFNLTVGTKKD
jgi:RNAse (barnase) inhibitor barstar